MHRLTTIRNNIAEYHRRKSLAPWELEELRRADRMPSSKLRDRVALALAVLFGRQV